MGVNSLPKTVTRQRRDCDLNPDPSAPESSTLTTRLPSHPFATNKPEFGDRRSSPGERRVFLWADPAGWSIRRRRSATSVVRTRQDEPAAGWVTAVAAMRPDSTRLQSIHDVASAAQFTTIPAPPGGDWMTHESRDPIDRRADRVDGGRGALTSPGRHAGQARIRDILSPNICHRTQPETTLNKHFGKRPMDEIL